MLGSDPDSCGMATSTPTMVPVKCIHSFKVFAAGYSVDEKTALFSGTAKRVYRLEL